MQHIFWGSCLNTLPFTVKFMKVRVAFTHKMKRWKILPTVNQGSGRPPAARSLVGFSTPPTLIASVYCSSFGGVPMNLNKQIVGTASCIVDLCWKDAWKTAENKRFYNKFAWGRFCCFCLLSNHTRKERKKERKKATKTTSFLQLIGTQSSPTIGYQWSYGAPEINGVINKWLTWWLCSPRNKWSFVSTLLK